MTPAPPPGTSENSLWAALYARAARNERTTVIASEHLAGVTWAWLDPSTRVASKVALVRC